MSGTENILRRKSLGTVWGLSALALSTIVLSASTGCRCLSPKKNAITTAATEASRFVESPAPTPPMTASGTTTVYKPPVFTEEFVTSASAFRPIVPEHFQDTPVREPAPLSDISQTKNDELADRVRELERQLERTLAESEAKVREAEKAAEEAAKKAAAVPRPIPPVVTEVAKPPRKVPVLTAPGLTVTTEADRIRFSVTDQTIFVPGTNRISPEAEETFRKIVAEIRAVEPTASLEIEGHTDSLNTDPANPMKKHETSSVKAVAVMEFFVKSLLWSHEKIRTSAYGASRPVADNGTPEGRLKNNRVDIVVIPE